MPPVKTWRKCFESVQVMYRDIGRCLRMTLPTALGPPDDLHEQVLRRQSSQPPTQLTAMTTVHQQRHPSDRLFGRTRVTSAHCDPAGDRCTAERRADSEALSINGTKACDALHA